MLFSSNLSISLASYICITSNLSFLVVPATYVKLGCFKDSGVKPRPMPILFFNGRTTGKIDWFNIGKYVQLCAEEAKKNR